MTAHVYPDAKWEDTLAIVDRTSPYALTGAVFARDRAAVRQAMSALRNAAGNFYINDKPTGAVVGQQPFGGARGSGTNDKAGSKLNLVRWVSARTVKETLRAAARLQVSVHGRRIGASDAAPFHPAGRACRCFSRSRLLLASSRCSGVTLNSSRQLPRPPVPLPHRS